LTNDAEGAWSSSGIVTLEQFTPILVVNLTRDTSDQITLILIYHDEMAQQKTGGRMTVR
jgi:hypothetical protein